MTEQGDAAGNAAPGTATGAPGTGGQPDYKALHEASQKKADEYFNRFTGLQGKYQQEQERWRADTTKLFDVEAALRAATGEKEALAIEVDTLTKSLAEQKDANDKASAKVSRMQLIGSKFPALQGLEAEGLLPEGSGDDLIAKLTKLNEKFVGQGQTAVENFKKGETPPPPADPGTLTSDSVFKQAYAAQKAGKPQEEYDRLYDQAVALRAKEKGTK